MEGLLKEIALNLSVHVRFLFNDRNEDRMSHELLNALKRDKARTKVLNFSAIGLVELTRQRMRRSLESASYQECPYCKGRGTVKSLLTMSIEVIRLLEKRLKGERRKRAELTINPGLKVYLVQNYKRTLIWLGKRSRCTIAIKDDPQLHIEDVRLDIK